MQPTRRTERCVYREGGGRVLRLGQAKESFPPYHDIGKKIVTFALKSRFKVFYYHLKKNIKL